LEEAQLGAFLECLDVSLRHAKALVIKLTATELSHVQRISTRCRDSKQCALVFKESFQGLRGVLGDTRAPPPPPLRDGGSGDLRGGGGQSPAAVFASLPPSSSDKKAAAQTKRDSVRLVQGLVIAYENMGRVQRRKAVLRERDFLSQLAPLLEMAHEYSYWNPDDDEMGGGVPSSYTSFVSGRGNHRVARP